MVDQKKFDADSSKKTRKDFYLREDQLEKLDEIWGYLSKLGKQVTYSDILMEGFGIYSKIVEAEYFAKYKETAKQCQEDQRL